MEIAVARPEEVQEWTKWLWEYWRLVSLVQFVDRSPLLSVQQTLVHQPHPIRYSVDLP